MVKTRPSLACLALAAAVLACLALTASPAGRVTIRFVAKKVLAGGLFDVRLLRADAIGEAK